MKRRALLGTAAAGAIGLLIPSRTDAAATPTPSQRMHVYQRFEHDGSFGYVYFRTVEWNSNGKLYRVGAEERIVVPVTVCD